MLDIIKVIILGIVEGITEWLPVSSTGHLILVGNVLKPSMSDAFMEMFDVVIQLGAIMAVVVLYFHKLNPFSPRKSHKQKMLTWQMWIKVLIASVPAGIVGVLFNDILDEIFYKPIPVAVMLIVYGILFIVVENHNAGKKPSVTRISQLSVQMLLWIGFFQMLALIPGTSRSGATIVGALLIGVSREVAAEFIRLKPRNVYPYLMISFKQRYFILIQAIGIIFYLIVFCKLRSIDPGRRSSRNIKVKIICDHLVRRYLPVCK